jgi:hypothetical protein
MKEIGVTDRTRTTRRGRCLMEKFDPKGDLEAYAKGFPVNNIKG